MNLSSNNPMILSLVIIGIATMTSSVVGLRRSSWYAL